MRTHTATAKHLASLVLSFALSISIIVAFSPTQALAVTQEEVDAAQASLAAAQSEAQAAAEAYYVAFDAHNAAVAAMEEQQKLIDELKSKISKNQDKLASRAVSMYRSGSLTMIDVLFGTSSFVDFATTWNLLTDMNESDAELIASTKEMKAEAEVAQEEYERQERIAAEELAASENAKAEVDAKAAAYEEQFNSLSAELQAQIIEANRIASENGGSAGADSQSDDSSQSQDESSDGTSSGSSSSGGSTSGSGSGSGSSGYVYNGGSSTCDVSLALAQVGKPYSWGAKGPDAFDCSGLCYYCGAPYGSSSALYSNASSRVPVSEAQPGDVLWKSGHVGIYIGGGQYVHASDYGVGVIVSNVSSSGFSYALRF